jgi:predicted  nucleic acid-binding Zn-ribbon protein
MPPLLETVVALQKALSQLDDLDRRLSGVPEEMRELHDRYTAGKAELDGLQRIVEQSRAERRAAETASQDCAARLAHFQEQVNRVRTQREYSAILQEIDQVREQARALEDQTLAAMERQEEAEAAIATLRQEFDEVERRYAIELEKWEAAKPGVVARAEALRAEIEELRLDVPSASMMLFERIREAHAGQALAEVREARRLPRGPSLWHCAACSYNVRPQVVMEIRDKGSLVQCDSCKRLLYIEEPAA